ncbi:MAG TPA: hypothetical protein VGD01_16500 [Candidatus Elarobacter sp.]|jgi:hypothetical protein
MREKPRRDGILRYSQGPAGTHLYGFESRWGYHENRATARFFIYSIAFYPSRLMGVRIQRVKLAAFEKYGEVASGAFIALVGLVFLFIPAL